jgi:ABC-type amino acid transport substrate-binding protein
MKSKTTKRRRPRALGLLALLLPMVVFAPVAECADSLVILQPGYPGSTKDASAFVKDLCQTVTEFGGALSGGEYHNDEAQGLKAIERQGAGVGIVSLGVFLKHRKSLSMRPLLITEPAGSCRLLVKKGAFSDIKELAGKVVMSTAFAEPEFVDRVILGHAVTEPAGSLCADWKTSRAKSFSQGLRKLKKARCDAVLLNPREFDGYETRLKKAEDGLVVLHTSRSYPAAVVVVFGDALPEARIGKLIAALETLSRDEGGEKLLERMGTRGFVRVKSKSLAPFEELFKRNGPADRGADAREVDK